MAIRPLKPRKHPMSVTLEGIEELSLFPNEAERQRAIAAHAESINGWGFVLGMLICVVIGVSSLVLSRVLVNTLHHVLPWGLPAAVRDVLPFALVALCMFLTVCTLHRWGVRRALRQRLLALGVPVCMHCGYALRGLPGDAQACPECGKEICCEALILLKAAADQAKAVDANPHETVDESGQPAHREAPLMSADERE